MKTSLCYRTTFLVAALIIFSLYAIYNTGYYNYDEHFQLIEFAQLKSGNTTASDLAWEYHLQIRPATQPVIAYCFISFLRCLSINDPGLIMIFLRIITGIVSVLTINYFLKKTEHLVDPNLKVLYYLISYFLWFIPFITVRFTSESYSGIAFTLSAALTYATNKNRFYLIGLLLGLSFLFRFQTAFMSLGLILWLLCIEKIPLKNIVYLLAGTISMVCVGLVIDCWYYGSFTITPYNYFTVNIIRNVASNYGVAPWYYYFIESVKSAVIPIGVFIWISIIFQFLTWNRTFISWILVPFIVVHIFIPHKELRFLFPCCMLIPLAVTLFIQRLLSIKSSVKYRLRPLIFITVAVIFIINLCATIIVMLSPVDGEGLINVTEAINHKYKNKKVILWTLNVENPYQPLSLRQSFYENKNVFVRPLENSISPLLFSNDQVNLLLVRRSEIDKKNQPVKRYNLDEIYRGTPEWINGLKNEIGYKSDPIILYKIKKTVRNVP